MIKHLNHSSTAITFSNFILILFTCSCLFSCISTKKVAFVDNEEKQEGIYKTEDWSYKIQNGDRFYISITDPLSNISLGASEIKNNVTSSTQGNFFQQQPTINDYLVRIDGTVDLPIIGRIKIAGIELDSLSYYLTEKCEGYISNPSIRVFMMNYNVIVLGEVNKPGFYQLLTNKPNFFDAIGLAGDLTDFANRSEVQIQRKNENGNVIVENVNLLDPGFISSPYYYTRPNDVIHIRPLKVKKFSNENALPLILSTITTLFTIFTISRSN